jgi:hypothetical protein
MKKLRWPFRKGTYFWALIFVGINLH